MTTESIRIRVLRNTWHETLENLGLQSDKDSRVFNNILERYGAPTRFYHGIKHISFCVTLAQMLAKDHRYLNEIILALFFHDIIQDPKNPGQDDEEQSAIFVQKTLGIMGISEYSLDLIKGAIRATRTHTGAQPGSVASWVCDMDLAVLGDTYEENFELYERGIRAEYNWVEIEDYNRERAKFLRGFLARDQIYCNPFVQMWLEESARSNISGLIARLEDGNTGKCMHQADG